MTSSLRTEDVEQFVARLRERLDTGAREYGDSSFRRPPAELLAEIQDELVDVAGWGLLLWTRIARLRDRVAQLRAEGANDE